MGKNLKTIKDSLRDALKAEDRYSPSLEPQIDIAAGYALAFQKLTKELEDLDVVIVRDTEDLDSVPELDEAVRSFPTISENYRKALACIGLAAAVVEESPKVGRPSKTLPATTDEDELAKLMSKVTGNSND